MVSAGIAQGAVVSILGKAELNICFQLFDRVEKFLLETERALFGVELPRAVRQPPGYVLVEGGGGLHPGLSLLAAATFTTRSRPAAFFHLSE